MRIYIHVYTCVYKYRFTMSTSLHYTLHYIDYLFYIRSARVNKQFTLLARTFVSISYNLIGQSLFADWSIPNREMTTIDNLRIVEVSYYSYYDVLLYICVYTIYYIYTLYIYHIII